MRDRTSNPIRDARRHLLLAALTVLAALLAGCAPGSPTQTPPTPDATPPRASVTEAALVGTSPSRLDSGAVARPPFFAVAPRGGARLYLMGTVHAGPPEGWTYSAEIDDAFDASEGLVLEIDLAALDEDALADAIAARAILQGGARLPDVLQPETRALLDERNPLLVEVGLTPRARDLYEPWFLTLRLVEIVARESPLSLEASVENGLLERRGEKSVEGLETFSEQLDLFDRLDPKLQDLLLRESLMRLDHAALDLDRLVEAWRIGDRSALLEESRAGVGALPDLEAFYEVLVDRRNARWAVELDALLRDEGRAGQTLFVAVGALHLVGDAGVPALLEREGHRVTEIH